MKRLTTQEFIEKARKIHGARYNYNKVDYINNNTDICITCPVHGDFYQKPSVHLQGSGCVKCHQERCNAESFIAQSNTIHNNKYDYSKVNYINNTTKVCIICPVHGEFWQRPSLHKQGQGCPKCAYESKSKLSTLTTEQFIERARKVHGDKYDYSKVVYKNRKTKICIICPEHGEFWQTPGTHLQNEGCPQCSKTHKLSKEEFIEKARKVHGDKYDYSQMEYTNMCSNIKIICPVHGEFWQNAGSHINGRGCAKCSGKYKWTTTEWVKEAYKVHGDKYDYSKVNYINNKTKIRIICPEHGDFWQIPNDHLSGKGCPLCNMSHQERDILLFLKKENIQFIYQCNKKYFKWLEQQSLDFYLPDYNIAIECQGIQHFNPVDFSGNTPKEEQIVNLEIIKKRDAIKNKRCCDNGVKLIYYSYFKKPNMICSINEIKNLILDK